MAGWVLWCLCISINFIHEAEQLERIPELRDPLQEVETQPLKERLSILPLQQQALFQALLHIDVALSQEEHVH